MAGALFNCVKLVFIIILKIILFCVRPKCKKLDKKSSRKRLGCQDRQRTSSPVEVRPTRGVNFSGEVSSVHSDNSNDTDVHDSAWGTFAEYDVPGEKRDLDFEEQRIILERLAGENRRLQMELVKNNQTTFERVTSDVAFCAKRPPSIDALPCATTQRRRMFLSVDDISKVCETDVSVDENVVSKLGKWRSMDALPQMITTTTGSMFLTVADVSAARDLDEPEDENVQQIHQTRCDQADQELDENVQQIHQTRCDQADQELDENVQHIPETKTKSSKAVGTKKQTGSPDIRDMIRTIKRLQYQNAHLKMYISKIMGTIMSQEPSLLEK